jgi:hypothetical protein
MQSQPNFGGVMMWYVPFQAICVLTIRDAKLAFANVVSDGNNFAQAVKNALSGSSSGSNPGSSAAPQATSPAANAGTTPVQTGGSTPTTAVRKAKAAKVRVTKY